MVFYSYFLPPQTIGVQCIYIYTLLFYTAEFVDAIALSLGVYYYYYYYRYHRVDELLNFIRFENFARPWKIK